MPNWGKANPYQTLLAAALARQGYAATLCDYPKARLPLLRLLRQHPDTGVLHLHWITPWIKPHFWTTNPLKRLAKLFLLSLDLRLCRLLGVRTVWTIHNLVSHESEDSAWELRLRRAIARQVDVCLVHSRSAVGVLEQSYGVPLAAKTRVVPHASYVGQYPSAEPEAVTLVRHELGLDEGDFVYLFLGAIRRYKGIDRLIEAFSALPARNARLAIVGSVLDPRMEDWLRAKVAGDDRIALRVGYVPDEALPVYLELASVVVLPFAQTLTSGSALLAMSFGKPLILPDAARVYDFPGDRGALYFAEGGLAGALEAARHADLAAMADFNLTEAEKRTWPRMGALTAAAYERPELRSSKAAFGRGKPQQGRT
ncbi:glycosyltransferase family 4 protein [Pelagibius sp.]|uniref:glycosyltransferase family 4 protein n=1 Tax=Pelagibius sp. TaxID=1931238 RepID=UPI003B508CB1